MDIVVIGQNNDVKNAISGMLNDKPGFQVSKVAFEKPIKNHEISLLENAGIIIIDLSTARANTRFLIMEIREIFPEARIIALHIYKDIYLVKPIIEAGADAYLVVDTLPRELLKSIGEIRTGNKFISSEVK